jgi:hypothetical protein
VEIGSAIVQASKAYLAAGVAKETATSAFDTGVALRTLVSPNATPEQKAAAAKELATTIGELTANAMLGRTFGSRELPESGSHPSRQGAPDGASRGADTNADRSGTAQPGRGDAQARPGNR